MNKEIVIQKGRGETSAAVFEEDRLVEYYLERSGGAQLTGNIYKGRVDNVLPGMQAAFIDIGLDKNAYLYVDDVVMTVDGVRDISHLLKSGQEVLVQVAKEPVGSKGPRVTGKLSLPGRYVVLLPNCKDVGISRKIVDETVRSRIKAFAEQMRQRYQHGIIVRTCALEATDEQLENDYLRLLALWQNVCTRVAEAKAPALVHRDNALPERILRDLWTEDVSYMVVNDEAAYAGLKQVMRGQSGHCRLRLIDDEKIELLYNIRAEVDKALKRRVWLKNGGYLVIDQTEALTVIDVNTGKFVGTNDLQDTILQMNLEAAAEIARQIRLRNLGGIIIVDFIDMQDGNSKARLLEALTRELEPSRIKAQVLGLTQLGLVEITRKKNGVSLAALLEKPCPYCDGKGRILSEETTAGRIRRELTEVAERTEAAAIAVTCHPLAAAALIGENGQRLAELRRELGKEIIVQGRSDQMPEAFVIQAVHRQAAVQGSLAPVLPKEIVRLIVSAVHKEQISDGIGRIEGFVIQIRNAAPFVGQELLVEIDHVYATHAIAHKL